MSSNTDPDPTQPCACTALRKASRAVSRLYEEQFGEAGMTVTQFAVLRALDRQPDQPLSRLAEAMVMDRTSLYRLLAPMERDGLIAIDAGPGRARIAHMTMEGRAAMERAVPIWAETQKAFIDKFGRAEWTSLSATLNRVVDAAGEMAS